jgi:PleD family two-component response regulator
VTKPLAFVFYENLLSGQQLANRLQDIGYRVQTITDISQLQIQTQAQKPMLLVAEFASAKSLLSEAIRALKENSETAHIPILAYVAGGNANLTEAARAAGATLVANEAGLLEQLPQLLEQVLQVD